MINKHKSLLFVLASISLMLFLVIGFPNNAYSNEVLLGEYLCEEPSGIGHIYNQVIFSASGDATHGINREFSKIHNAIGADDCEYRLSAMNAVLVNMECTVGGVIYSEPYNVFKFVCDGKRKKIIDVISEISKEIINPTVISTE